MDVPKVGGDGGGEKREPKVFSGEQNFDDWDLKRPDRSTGTKVALGEAARGIEMFSAPERPETVGTTGATETTELTETTGATEMPRMPEMTGVPVTPEMVEALKTPEMVPDPELLSEMTADFPGMTESRPLAEGGSTEGKIDKKKILAFDGDLIDKESQKEVEKVIKEYDSNPYELDNIRNQMMADGLRDNYGRIFGSDNEKEQSA